MASVSSSDGLRKLNTFRLSRATAVQGRCLAHQWRNGKKHPLSVCICDNTLPFSFSFSFSFSLSLSLSLSRCSSLLDCVCRRRHAKDKVEWHVVCMPRTRTHKLPKLLAVKSVKVVEE
jgi:hypothetical protein